MTELQQFLYIDILRQVEKRVYLCTKNRNEMNNENLKPTTQLTESERRELARIGGIASGEARRHKKSMREWAEALGECVMTLKMPDGSVIDADINAAVVLKQMEKAINKKDTNAATFLMRLRGEDVQKHEFVDEDEKRARIREEMERLYGVKDGEQDR